MHYHIEEVLLNHLELVFLILLHFGCNQTFSSFYTVIFDVLCIHIQMCNSSLLSEFGHNC